MRKRMTGYHVLMILLVLLALLGSAVMIWGAMNHTPSPQGMPWTVARCMLHG